jgi:hypothetical protein
LDTAIIVALITGAATVIAAAVAILPKWMRNDSASRLTASSAPLLEGNPGSGARVVYYKDAQYRFLKFGGKNCRIEPMNGGQSFLAPTHELFHDPEQKRRVTRDSIVVRV